MARRQSVKLNLHQASGRLCKCIGMVLGRDGKPKKKNWYFDPSDEGAAVARVIQLKARWKRLRSTGRLVWDEEEAYLGERHSVDPGAAERPAVVTVRHGVDLYLEHLRQQHEAGQFTRSHYVSQEYRLTKAAEPIERLPLNMVNEQQLQKAVLLLAKRPSMKLHRPLPRTAGRAPAKQKDRRMSVSYAKSAAASLKWCFRWLDESKLWDRPRRFDRIFKIRPVVNADEQHRQLAGATEVDHFTLDELTKLWKPANDRQRLYMLLGLNCAFANAECASLRTTEVKDLHGDSPRIERFRTKTIKTAGKGSYAQWHLWSETTALLQKHHAPANPTGLFLLTESGLPLTENASIGQSWNRLVSTAGVRRLTFKYLRKTAAHLVRNHLGFGVEVADMLLSHSDSGIIKHYAGRDWLRLKAATTAMHEYLKPLFAAQVR